MTISLDFGFRLTFYSLRVGARAGCSVPGGNQPVELKLSQVLPPAGAACACGWTD